MKGLIHRLRFGHWPAWGRVPFPVGEGEYTRVVYGPWYCRACPR